MWTPPKNTSHPPKALLTFISHQNTFSNQKQKTYFKTHISKPSSTIP
jgi:hypothetical protein